MEITSTHNGSSSMMWFFNGRGFDDRSIQGMFRRCRHLEGTRQERASENWAYLKSIGIQERKLPSIISKCSKIFVLGLNEKIVPMVQCLMTLGTKPNEVASAIAMFPHILSLGTNIYETLEALRKGNTSVISYNGEKKKNRF